MFVSEKEIEVRYAETDQMGVVYHANYLIYMEVGRTNFVKAAGFSYPQLEAAGFISPVMDISIQYKASLKYGQKAIVRTVEEHTKLRTTYGYEIVHEDGTIAATAKSVNIIAKRENFRPVPLSKVNPAWDAKYREIARIQTQAHKVE